MVLCYVFLCIVGNSAVFFASNLFCFDSCCGSHQLVMLFASLCSWRWGGTLSFSAPILLLYTTHRPSQCGAFSNIVLFLSLRLWRRGTFLGFASFFVHHSCFLNNLFFFFLCMVWAQDCFSQSGHDVSSCFIFGDHTCLWHVKVQDEGSLFAAVRGLHFDKDKGC